MAAPALSRPAVFFLAYAADLRIQRAARDAGAALNAIPGVGTGRMGLTPDAVKSSPAYRAARAAYDRAAGNARQHAAAMVKAFPKETRAASYARRARLEIR